MAKKYLFNENKKIAFQAQTKVFFKMLNGLEKDLKTSLKKVDEDMKVSIIALLESTIPHIKRIIAVAFDEIEEYGYVSGECENDLSGYVTILLNNIGSILKAPYFSDAVPELVAKIRKVYLNFEEEEKNITSIMGNLVAIIRQKPAS